MTKELKLKAGIIISILILISISLVVFNIIEKQNKLPKGWVDYKDWSPNKYEKVNRAISRNRRERNLARQHGKDLSTIVNYLNR